MDKLLHWFWMNGVFYILYLLLVIVGLLVTKWIIEVPLQSKLNQYQHLNRLRKLRNVQEKSETRSYKNSFFRHLYLLINTTSKAESEQNVLAFMVISTSLFIGTFTMIILYIGDILFSVLIGLLVASIPYMLLQVRLRKLRFLMGQEFLNILQVLTQSYNAHSFDMYYALIETQKSIQNKDLRQVFLKLISELQVSRNEEDLRLSIQTFIYTAGTSWAKRLGNIILKAYLYNENVLNTLLVLTRQVEETEEMLEQEKSLTMDKVADGYLTTILFIAYLIIGYQITGPQDWFALQFENKWTLVLFILSLVGVIFSVLIALILKRPKNDI